MALLIAGTGISVWQAVRATKAKGDANLSAQDAIASEIKAVAALKQVTGERDAKNEALAAESAQRELAERQFVAGVLRPIGYGVKPEEGELLSFVDWTTLPDSRLQLKVLEVAFEKPESAFRLSRRSERTIQAAVGLSPQRRARTLEFLSAQQRLLQAEPQIRVAACWLAMELGSSELPALAEAITWLGDPRSETESTFDDFRKFITAMTQQRDELRPEQVTCGWDALVALLEKSNFARYSDATGIGLAALAPQLSLEQATRCCDALVAVLEKVPDDATQLAAANGMGALAPRLTPEQVTRSWDGLVVLLGRSGSSSVQEAARDALAALVPRLSPEQVPRGLDALDILLQKRLDPQKLLEA